MIGIPCRKIDILKDPKEFYEYLIKKMPDCKNRITLSALYLGTGEKEKHLLDTLEKSVEKNEQLECNLLFDYTRSTRSDGPGQSSKDLLTRVTSNNRFKVSFFLSPMFSNFFTRKLILPREKHNEIISLQHMKIFVLDDQVIVSGANLSHQYFTDRVDRYFVFHNKDLADYLDEVAKTVASFSLKLHSNGLMSHHESWEHPISSPHYIQHARERIQSVKKRFSKSCLEFNQLQESNHTIVMPFIQANCLGINDEENFLSKILTRPPSESIVRLASGYFNLTQGFKEKLLGLEEDISCDVLMASEDVNSFKGANGLMGSIPSFYTTMSKLFWQEMQRSNKNNIRIWSFFKPNWTFHAKGLWIENKKENTMLATIGSSNFGYRSVFRDLELQLVLVTREEQLKTRLRDEYETIWKDSKQIKSDSDFPPVATWVTLISRFIKSFF